MKTIISTAKKYILNPNYCMYTMLVVSYFSLSRIFYDCMGIFRKGILVWGSFLLLILATKKLEILKNKYSILMLLFCVVNFITVFLNFQGRFFNGIVTMVYVSIFLIVFFNASEWNGKNRKSRTTTIDILLKIHTYLSFLFAVIAIVMFCFNIKGKYVSQGQDIFYGVRDNRLWGLYNPNTAATLCILSLVTSIILMRKSTNRKFLIFNMVMQMLYLILTQSRTGWVLLIGCIILYVIFLKIVPLIKEKCSIIRIVKISCIYMVLIICLACSPKFVKEILVKIPQSIVMLSSNQKKTVAEIEEEVSLKRIDAEKIAEQDATNGRSEIWRAGLQIFKDHPIWGIGSENVDKKAEEYLSGDRYKNLLKGGFHNSYITILVSSGIIGMSIFVIIFVCFVVEGFIFLWKSENEKYKILIIVLFTFMGNELFESRWLYNTSYINIIFWCIMGNVVREIAMEKKKIKKVNGIGR